MARRAELVTAFLWLTRLPAGRFLAGPAAVLAQTVWAFPLVGLAVAAIGSGVLLAGCAAGLAPLAAALLAVGATLLVTGALHEDGLADFADGCGGVDRARALEIMRDSRIGSYGVLALLVVVGLKVLALAGLLAGGVWFGVAALIAAAALSRAGMAVALRFMPAARVDGLGKMAGRPGPGAVAVALMLGLALLFWPAAVTGAPLTAWAAAALSCGLAQYAIARNARHRLGGQTGDVLGALQVVGDAAALLALSVFA